MYEPRFLTAEISPETVDARIAEARRMRSAYMCAMLRAAFRSIFGRPGHALPAATAAAG